MKILVCIKQVPDPEGPRDSFAINKDTMRVEPRGIPPVLSLFDENALEAALRIKDTYADGVDITVLSMGKRISNAVLQKALAVGADELIKVEGDEFDSAKLDSNSVASALALAIKKIGTYDLILFGRQSADWNAGQVGIYVAMELGVPAITLARSVEINDKRLKVERVIPNGFETVETSLPAVVVASNEVGELRYPTMIQRREAKNKPVIVWECEDIGFQGPANWVIVQKLYPAEIRQRECKMIQGSSPADAGKNLAKILKEERII